MAAKYAPVVASDLLRPCSHSARVLGSMHPPGAGHQYFSPNNPFLSHHLPSPHFRLKPLPVLTLKAEG
jgi:hypothetical protein